MVTHPLSIWLVIKEASRQWLDDKAPRLGAALAYYTVFSLAPLLIVVIGIAGLLFGHDAAQAGVTSEFENLVGARGAEAVRAMLASANQPGSGGVGSVLGIVMLVFGAAGLFGELQDALNTIWHVQPTPGRGLVGILRDRLLSFSMVIGVAFLLLASLVVSAALAALARLLHDWQTSVLGLCITTLVDLTVLTVLFAMIFRFLPDVRIAWRNVWLGAAITAVLFTVGKTAISVYLGHSGIASAYGAAGSLAVLLVWIYYTSQVFLFGAELTKAYANQRGSQVVPKPNADLTTAEVSGAPENPASGKSHGSPYRAAPAK
ncbi:MAG TPA: YihY/virulence factor BrkB family protein [Gemmataceae bacterium]|jgi:membrane protein